MPYWTKLLSFYPKVFIKIKYLQKLIWMLVGCECCYVNSGMYLHGWLTRTKRILNFTYQDCYLLIWIVVNKSIDKTVLSYNNPFINILLTSYLSIICRIKKINKIRMLNMRKVITWLEAFQIPDKPMSLLHRYTLRIYFMSYQHVTLNMCRYCM